MTAPWSPVVSMLVGYLAGMVRPIPVATEVPENRPPEFIQVRRVGGTAQAPVREAVRVDVFAWAASEERAYAIGNQVREAVWELGGQMLTGLPVYEVSEFMGPTMTADHETRTPQLWATYELLVRADGAIHRASAADSSTLAGPAYGDAHNAVVLINAELVNIPAGQVSGTGIARDATVQAVAATNALAGRAGPGTGTAYNATVNAVNDTGDEPMPISGLVANDQAAATSNTAIIQAALDAAAVAGPARPPFTGAGGDGGGTVWLPLGWYWVNGGLVIGNATELAGQGWGTVLALADGASTNATPKSILRLADNTAGCSVRNLRLYGNSANQTETGHLSHGIDLNRAGTVELYDGEIKVTDVLIFGCAGTGLYANAFAITGGFVRVSAYHCYDGFAAKTDVKFVECVAGNNTNKGFVIYAGTNGQFTACKAFGGQVGWAVSYSDMMSFVGCESEDTEVYGWDLTALSGTALEGCQAYRSSGAGGLRAALALHDDGAGTLPTNVSIRGFSAHGLESTGVHEFTHGIRLGILGPGCSFQGTLTGVTGPLVEDMTGGANPPAERMFLDVNNQLGTQRITYAASVTPSVYAGGTVLIGPLTGNITIANPSDGHTGARLTFLLTQDGTGGRTVSWGANFAPGSWTMPAGANASGKIEFVRTAAGTWVA